MSRLRYFGKRIIQTIVLLWLTLTFLFVLFKSMPGSFADIMMQQGASEAAIEAFRQKWGLDQPLYIQYWRYLVNFVQGDIGNSMQYGIPVWEYVNTKILNTMILVAPAITAGYIIGSIVGGVLGAQRGSLLEKIGVTGTISIGSFPEFFTGILLIIVFSSWLGLFPPGSLASSEIVSAHAEGSSPYWHIYFTTDFLHHYILPFLAVFLRFFFVPVLTMRTSVIEVAEQDFMYFHRISGLPYVSRLGRLLRHASLPVISLYPVSMTRALSGLVLVELVFNWPGIGAALVSAVFARDFPVVQFVFFVTAAFVIIANFVVDFAYGIIDPRVSLGENESR